MPMYTRAALTLREKLFSAEAWPSASGETERREYAIDAQRVRLQRARP
jgi:hypothetical protein